ncbi:MAG: PQQ-binding-like beta-propeller repeat protein [Candidatus Aureabacteria bacterium]|nr:PQQ-binding-like beta-propeller repeat protein [Candidatus Auribacterota bacterium]
MKRNISIAMLFTAAIFLAIFCFDSGWAQPDPNSPWPMFHHDGRHTGLSSSAGPATSVLLWSYCTEENWAESSPVIGSDGMTYIGVGARLYAFNPNGSLSWSYLTEGNLEGSPALGNAGSIYVGISGSDTKGWYTAFNTAGAFQWSYLADNSYVDTSFNIGADGSLYVGSGEYDGHIYALNPSGSLKWSYQTYGEAYSVPAIGAQGEIYFGSNYLYSFSPNGALNWSSEKLDTGWSSPTLGRNSEIYIGSYDNLYAFNPNGSLDGSYPGSFFHSQPVLGNGGRIYVNADDNNLYALNTDSSLYWSYDAGQLEGLAASSPAVGSDGELYIASDNLYALASTGSLNWSYAASSKKSSPALGGNGRLYMQGTNTFYCLGQETPPAFMGVPSSSSPSVGERFTFDVVCQPMSRSFDAYGAVITPDGTIFSFNLANPMALRAGLQSLALSVPGIPTTVQRTLFVAPSIPQTAQGKTFTFIMGFVPPGAAPRVENVISGYLWNGSVSVR